MINSLRIQNLRSAVDVTCPLAPLTLVVGPNGSGKSTLLRAIRFLKEVASGAVQANPSFLEEVASGAAAADSTWRNDLQGSAVVVLPPSDNPLNSKFQASLSQLSDRSLLTHARNIVVRANLVGTNFVGTTIIAKPRPQVVADVIFDQHFYASIHNEYMRYQFLQLSNQIRALIDSVIINSDFSETAVFETNASSPSDDGTREVSRLGMFSALLSKIGPDDSIATMFTDYCRRLIGLEVASLLTPGPALEISLSGPSQSRLPYGAASLGSRYGMQLLAAILSGRLTGRRQASSIAVYEVPVEVESLVLAEEPETSLHPAAQVLIGEVMAECVGEDLELYYARESMVEGRLIDEVLEERRLRRIEWVDLARDEGRLIDEVLEERRLRGDSVPSNGLQIIATTHSPYVIQGVCKAIRDGKCSHESVVILNCSLKDNATHITPIHVSEAGHIDGWIPSFTDVDNYLFQGWVKGPVSRA